MSGDDWTPEKEAEDDPIKLQKEQIEIGRELLERVKKEEAAIKAREEAYAARAVQPGAGSPYKPPTFEEVSAVLKKAWDECERIMPTAGDRAKAMAFQTLMQAAAPRPSGFIE